MNDLRVTEVNVTPIKPANGLVGFANVVVNDALYLGSIGIHSKLDGSGFRITYPGKKLGNHNLDIYHPITRDAGSAIERAVITKCREVFERSDEHDRYDKARSARPQI